MSGDTRQNLQDSLLALDMQTTIVQVKSVIEGNSEINATEAADAITSALEIVGRRFQNGEWYLAELVYSGEIAKAALELLSPAMTLGIASGRGTIVVGTVAGDMHDLGKDIFINYSKSAGFNIVDLGVDVPTGTFISAVREHQPVALGMSCLLTITAPEVGKVIQALENEHLRDVVRVIIGGAALTETFATEVKADAFAPDAVTGTDIIKRWSE
ncbi:MAG: cobalamin B12-binding domain-containing protein [Chloroflexi bacterium]|nr:cobalamin B12-binding domain-containing protein [Chloroflexota bacterium]